jgi:Domain of unknown function (DUF5666)
MNAGPADTHLDLGDLIAEVTGQPVDDRAREHLARCEHCRAEANRWDLVAGGVRRLAAATPEPAQPAQPARPGGPRHTRLRVLAGPRRRTVLAASVAAALVLLAAVGYGASSFVHITFGAAGTGAGTVLTAVNGCTGLEQAVGTLEQVNGTSLVIKTASGQPVTVTTTASTFVSMSGALLSDITDGASVMVRGPRSGGTIEAVIVTVGPPFSAVNSPGFVPVRGTVSDANSAGFTLVTPTGTRVRVTTSADTLVVVPHASLGQLQHGATIFALGHAGPDGTLSARAVAAVSQLPPGVPPGLHAPAGAHRHISVHMRTRGHVRDCSPSVIAAGLVSAG